MSLLTKSKVATEHRITITEIAEIADGFALTAAEIGRRWDLRPDWAGRPSVSIADAAEVLAEGSGRYQQDRKLRDAWLSFSSELPQRRQRVTNDAADVAQRVYQAKTGYGIEDGRVIQQIRLDAARAAGLKFDAEQPKTMDEFARRSA